MDIKAHSFFNDIKWKDILNKKYKYYKQSLKIDLTQTNFDYESDDKYKIGINVDEECGLIPQNEDDFNNDNMPDNMMSDQFFSNPNFKLVKKGT